MTDQEAQQLADRYEIAFGNYGEVALPEFFFEARFHSLLQTALERGFALTQEEVAAVYPDAAWNF